MSDQPLDPATTALQLGDLLCCPHCHQWHPLTGDSTAEHEHVRSMLFFECRKSRFFAGTIGGRARYTTKPGHAIEKQ